MGCTNCGSKDAVQIAIGNTLHGTCKEKRCKEYLHILLDDAIVYAFRRKKEESKEA